MLSAEWEAGRSVTYTLFNLGNGTLKLTGSPRVAVNGQYARLDRNPAPSIAPGTSTSFRLRLSEIRPGHSASISISIPNTDSDESPYSFTLLYSSFYRYTPIYPPIQPPYRIMAQEGVEVLDAGTTPEEFVLEQNHPNPFNPNTTIGFQLPKTAEVTVTIFNIQGQKITTLLAQTLPAGKHRIQWDTTDHNGERVPSGTYLYVLEADAFRNVKKMTILK
jgi:hypothetical protein